MVIKNHKDVYDLLLFLSCFPNGIQKTYVAELMENQNEIDQGIKTLHRYSFLQELDDQVPINDEDKLQLVNFLMTYLQLDEGEKLRFMKTISGFYVEKLKDVYKSIMASDYDNYSALKGQKQAKDQMKAQKE